MRPVLGQPGHAREAAALLVHGAADLERPGQDDARAADRFRGVHRGREARLHVAAAAAVEAPVAHHAAEGLHRPARPGGDDVEVAVDVEDGRRAPLPRRVPTTLTRGCAAVCSALPSAVRYSTVEAAPRAAARR